MMRAVGVSLGLLTLVAAAGAQSPEAGAPKSDIRILPGEITTARFGAGIPDLGLDPSWVWQALICARHCELRPVQLAMTPVAVQPVIGASLPGHRYEIDGKLDAHPLVLIRGLPGTVPGTPETWLHAGLAAYPPADTPGTMEIDIPLPRGGRARIVPRHGGVVEGQHQLRVYLEIGTSRQRLATLSIDPVGGPAGLTRGGALLRWAGDLDGDGRVDLVMTLNNRVHEFAGATLFLSSAAGPGELVGRAATFEYWPVGLARR
jgi:hypothetical protein